MLPFLQTAHTLRSLIIILHSESTAFNANLATRSSAFKNVAHSIKGMNLSILEASHGYATSSSNQTSRRNEYTTQI